jgi:ketosteroid isomerase-like protein
MDKAYNAADVHPIYMKAFNVGDIEAIVACYESDGCFVSASGRVARGSTELREVYHNICQQTCLSAGRSQGSRGRE